MLFNTLFILLWWKILADGKCFDASTPNYAECQIVTLINQEKKNQSQIHLKSRNKTIY